MINGLVLILFQLSRCLFTDFDPNRFGRRPCDDRRTAYSPSTLSVLTAHKMAATGVLAPDLAGRGNLDSLAQTLMGLLFRHLAHPFKETIFSFCTPKPLCGVPF